MGERYGEKTPPPDMTRTEKKAYSCGFEDGFEEGYREAMEKASSGERMGSRMEERMGERHSYRDEDENRLGERRSRDSYGRFR